MKCFNCYHEFLPTLSKPICQKCGFCYYCRDFSCSHYDETKESLGGHISSTKYK